MRLAFSWPITYWSRMEQISCGAGRSDLPATALGSPLDSSRMMSLQRSMHSSQMNTDGPAISFLTSCWLLPQKEQYRSFSLEPFLSDIKERAGPRYVDARRLRLFAAFDKNLVDESVAYGILAGHEVVAVRVLRDLLDRLAGPFREDPV